jgi:hypothetical protein
VEAGDSQWARLNRRARTSSTDESYPSRNEEYPPLPDADRIVAARSR